MRLNSRLALVGAVSVLALALNPAAALAHDGGGHGHGHNLIKADFTPSQPKDAAIDGLTAGGLPWIIGEGKVRVRASGRMDVRIEGLQIPRNGAADNPIASINALLFCDGVKAGDSGPQPMTVPDGDARFRVTLDNVPRSCGMATVLISPTVSNGTVYIASAMADDEDDD